MIIGFTGLAGSGKDYTAAELSRLLTNAGVANQRLALAAPIKDTLAPVLGFTESDLDGDSKERVCKIHFFAHELVAEAYKDDYAPYLKCEIVVANFLNYLRQEFDCHWWQDESGYTVLEASPRQCFQAWGTVWRREDEQFWVNLFLPKANSFDGITIATDVRMDNEAVICENLYEVHSSLKKEINGHYTEAGVNPELLTCSLYNCKTKAYDYTIQSIFNENLHLWRK